MFLFILPTLNIQGVQIEIENMAEIHLWDSELKRSTQAFAYMQNKI